MRLSSCISLDLLYIHNGDEPSENCNHTDSSLLNFQCPECDPQPQYTTWHVCEFSVERKQFPYGYLLHRLQYSVEIWLGHVTILTDSSQFSSCLQKIVG